MSDVNLHPKNNEKGIPSQNTCLTSEMSLETKSIYHLKLELKALTHNLEKRPSELKQTSENLLESKNIVQKTSHHKKVPQIDLEKSKMIMEIERLTSELEEYNNRIMGRQYLSQLSSKSQKEEFKELIEIFKKMYPDLVPEENEAILKELMRKVEIYDKEIAQLKFKLVDTESHLQMIKDTSISKPVVVKDTKKFLLQLRFDASKFGQDFSTIISEIGENRASRQSVSLARRQVTSTQVKILCQALTLSKHVKFLSFGACGLDQDMMDDIAHMLINNTSIKTLNLYSNPLIGGNNSISNLMNALKGNPSITNVSLADCGLGENDFDAIAVFLSENPPLQDLDLEGNKIGHHILSLFDSLGTNSNLICLNLQNNDITTDHIGSCLSSIDANHSLLKLDVSRNSIDSTPLMTWFSTSCKLETLIVSHELILNK